MFCKHDKKCNNNKCAGLYRDDGLAECMSFDIWETERKTKPRIKTFVEVFCRIHVKDHYRMKLKIRQLSTVGITHNIVHNGKYYP